MPVDISRRDHHLSNDDDHHKLAGQLDGMSASELTILLEQALEGMSEETYDAELIDTYLDALDRKAPIPDIDSAYANFEQLLRSLSPESPTSAPHAAPRKARPALRIRFVAIAAAICLLASLCVAQAAGLNVFGAFARWTSNTFSFGEIHSDDTKDYDTTSFDPKEYSTLQDALDALGVTEISEPTWIPEGYQLNVIDGVFSKEDDFLYLLAEYTTDGPHLFQIIIKSYVDQPDIQYQKTDTPVTTFSINGLEVYLFENTNNRVAAWVTEHYECSALGTVDTSTLKQIVLSIYDNDP